MLFSVYLNISKHKREPPPRLELGTFCLQGKRSTAELQGQYRGIYIYNSIFLYRFYLICINII